jgi:hypothetical protein
VQAAEIRHPRGGSHAAEKAVALYQQRGPAGARGCDRGGDAGGTAAENDDFEFADDRGVAGGFDDGLRFDQTFDATGFMIWAEFSTGGDMRKRTIIAVAAIAATACVKVLATYVVEKGKPVASPAK